jgi:hypothetical protein
MRWLSWFVVVHYNVILSVGVGYISTLTVLLWPFDIIIRFYQYDMIYSLLCIDIGLAEAFLSLMFPVNT